MQGDYMSCNTHGNLEEEEKKKEGEFLPPLQIHVHVALGSFLFLS
jgi:hypothetical protein